MKPIYWMFIKFLVYFFLYNIILNGFECLSKEKENELSPIYKRNVTLISPTIDPTMNLTKPGPKFDNVTYVKELSPGGKAALELVENGE